MALAILFCFVFDHSLAVITDPKIVAVLNSLPPQLRLDSVQPPGVDNKTCAGYWGKVGFVCSRKASLNYVSQDQQMMANLKAR